MTCGADIAVAVLGCIAGTLSCVVALSETLPFIKKISANGILHGITHLFQKEKCISVEDKPSK